MLDEAERLHRAGSLDGAERKCRAVLAFEPRNSDAVHRLGVIAYQLGRHDQAVGLLAEATHLNRKAPAFFNNYGLAQHAKGRLAEAAASFRRALTLKADFPAAHNNLGSVLKQLGDSDGAMLCFRRAIALDHGYAAPCLNLAVALAERCELDEALGCVERAIAIDPGHVEAYVGLGSTLRLLGRFNEAEQCFDRAISIRPGYAEAHVDRAYFLLMRGVLEQGWKDYEWRIKASGGVDYLPDPRNPATLLPRPSSLLPIEFAHKRMLLVHDQGIGDDIFFLRFAPLLQARGAWTAYLASPKIASLLARSPGLDAVIADGPLPPDLDFIFLVPDVPLIVGCNRPQDIPPPLQLYPLPDRIEKLTTRLGALGTGPWLGVTWRAGSPAPHHGARAGKLKEIPLTALARAISTWRGNVVVLQRHPRAEEMAELSRALGRSVADCSDLNEDLEDMLALLSAIDEYVGVSNTNMHLLAGLGRPGRVLLQTPPPVWRWPMQGMESAWFPGFRIYREQPGGRWSEAVLDALAEDLRASVMRV